MSEYISLEELLEKAQQNNIDLGKGDPYNRLRYYTKMGWIPHMVRKKDETGSIKGHYDISTLNRLLKIQELKNKGLTNEEITQKIQTKDKVQDMYSKVFSERARNLFIRYATFVMLLTIFAAELGFISIGKSKDSQIILQASAVPTTANTQLIATGTSFISKGVNTVFVRDDKIRASSKVYVTFTQSYTPASKFWVADKVVGEGFLIELDAPVMNNVSFDWWISN